MSLLWILAGLVGLWDGSELALRGTIEVAERRGLSQGFLGVTVLAIGTDLPELLVAITGGLAQLAGKDASGVVVGNAVGSALAQLVAEGGATDDATLQMASSEAGEVVK